MKQQGSSRSWPGLGEHLRRQHTQREAGIDDFIRQAVGGTLAALDDRVETDVLRVANAFGELGEGLSVVEIRREHDVSGSPEPVGESQAPTGQAVGVMKEQNLSHVEGL